MKASALISTALTLFLLTAGAAQGKSKEEGGYYYSLTHPSFGLHEEKREGYKTGEGYYASVPGAVDDSGKRSADETAQKMPAAAAAPATPYAAQRELSMVTPSSAPLPATVVHAAPTTTANNPQLAQLEDHLFSLNYETETDATRLSRLEHFVFGSTKSGAIAQRIANLTSALSAPQVAPKTPAPSVKAEPTALTYDGYMKQGKTYFGQNAFHAAAEAFEAATQQKPNDQTAHFWLGMTFWHLYDYANARYELDIVLRLNPFDSEGQVARAKLPEITAYMARQQSPPVDSPHMVRQAIGSIAGQAASLQQQKLLEGQLTADWRTNLADLESDKITRDTQSYLRSQYRDGRHFGYRPANLDEVSDLGYIASHYAMTDGRVQANRALIDSYQRANSIDDWQNYLLSAMSSPWRPGQPHLRAFGSNLYVQYYGDEDPFNPPLFAPSDPPLQAMAQHRPPAGKHVAPPP